MTMSEQDSRLGKTSEIEMIATRVVDRQSRMCTIGMDSIKDDIEKLTAIVSRMNDRWDKHIPPLVTDVAVLKTRWQLFGIVGTVIGAAGTLIGILIAALK